MKRLCDTLPAQGSPCHAECGDAEPNRCYPTGIDNNRRFLLSHPNRDESPDDRKQVERIAMMVGYPQGDERSEDEQYDRPSELG